jgi:hypothetical protein
MRFDLGHCGGKRNSEPLLISIYPGKGPVSIDTTTSDGHGYSTAAFTPLQRSMRRDVKEYLGRHSISERSGVNAA